jgi:hypothetical protein
MSVRPPPFSPQATAPARKPGASSPGSVSSTPSGAATHLERKKPLGLLEAQHQVQVLDRLAGGSLPEVVDRRECHRAAGRRIDGDVDPAEIRVAQVADPGRVVDHLDEGLTAVPLRVQPVQLGGVHLAGGGHEAARHQPLVKRHQVGYKRDPPPPLLPGSRRRPVSR